MSDPLTSEIVSEFLLEEKWVSRFENSVLSAARKLVGARAVSGVSASIMDTGDCEITGGVAEKSGETFSPVIAVWREGGSLVLEGDCGCDAAINCVHSAALLCYLIKGGGSRIDAAFGGSPHAESAIVAPVELEDSLPDAKRESSADFLLQVENRPEGDDFFWMPDIVASAYAMYGEYQAPLEPSGKLTPIAGQGEKIARDRARETEALRALYALDFEPGAEEPPQSLRKLKRPESEGTLWSPSRKKWPHAKYFWQRFRHEGVPALEKRGWRVEFAPGVGHQPLVFRSDTWRAEIVDEGRGWFHLSAGFEIDGESFELQPILATLVRYDFLELTKAMDGAMPFLLFLPDGRGLSLPVGRFRKIMETLGQLTEFSFTGGGIRLSKLDAAALTAIGEVSVGEAPREIRELSNEIENRGAPAGEVADVPEGVHATLREYQVEGFRWMQFLARHGLNGILADDMGLGKTLQSLAHILAEREGMRNEILPTLVVAPTSVVENWRKEAERFVPSLKVLVLQGATREKRFSRIPSSDLVLTSYALLHRDEEVLTQQLFHLVILDEAQHIKNPEANVTRIAGTLRARHRLCLSGTPVENSLGELWSLFHFLQPGFLGQKDAFRDTWQTPIERNGNEARRKALAQRLGPLILRRTKNEVAKELPLKTELVHPIEMNEGQKDLYETVRSTMDKQVRQALAIRGNQAQIVFLDALLKLRQICCHPVLIRREETETESAKFEYLVELLDTLRSENHRVLLFSQFTSMLGIIENHLEGIGCSFLKLTGETKNRQQLVDRFQSGEGEVFLISLKAGGTGLTLTGADNVIHYDPWWNPAAENQATDRAYRIGQDKPVFVHKLICTNTVEERIQQMQEKKDSLATDILSGASRKWELNEDSMQALLAPMG